MSRLHFTKTKDGAIVEVGAGFSLKRFIRECAKRGLGGLEKLYWIPGSVGGGIRMNAGSFGQSISDTLTGIDILNDQGEITGKETEPGDFGYRASIVKTSECVIHRAISPERCRQGSASTRYGLCLPGKKTETPHGIPVRRFDI